MASSSNFAASAQNVQSEHLRAVSSSSEQRPTISNVNGSTVDDAGTTDILMGMDSQFLQNNSSADTASNTFGLQSPTSNGLGNNHHNDFPSVTATYEPDRDFGNWDYRSLWNPGSDSLESFGDMMIESQDVDMSMLGLDMMPWFEPTQEYLGFFDPSNQPSPADLDGATTGGGAQGTPQG